MMDLVTPHLEGIFFACKIFINCFVSGFHHGFDILKTRRMYQFLTIYKSQNKCDSTWYIRNRHFSLVLIFERYCYVQNLVVQNIVVFSSSPSNSALPYRTQVFSQKWFPSAEFDLITSIMIYRLDLNYSLRTKGVASVIANKSILIYRHTSSRNLLRVHAFGSIYRSFLHGNETSVLHRIFSAVIRYQTEM